MPQRFLRPGITNSERWNSVSWRAQSLYIRILTLVDDYGRYDGRPSVIHGNCFAVWNEKHPNETVTLLHVMEDLQQLAASQLILMYDVAEKKVCQILQWQERIRDGTISKWPPFPFSDGKNESCSKLLLPSPSPTSSPTPSPNGQAMIAFDRFWKAYPRKVGKSVAQKSFFRLNCHTNIEKILKSVEVQKKGFDWIKDGGQFIPHPTTWLNQGRWDDEGIQLFNGHPQRDRDTWPGDPRFSLTKPPPTHASPELRQAYDHWKQKRMKEKSYD